MTKTVTGGFLRSVLKILALALVLLASLPAMAAELTGQSRGTVIDDGGLEVPGAVVTATSDSLMGSRGSTSDEAGRFLIAGLPPGLYTVEVTMPGMVTLRTEEVGVRAGSTSALSFTLQVAQAGMEVLIVDERELVDTEQVRTGLTLGAAEMKDLPNVGRDYQSIIALAPGVVGSGNANVRGGFDDQNQFFVDGVNVTDPITNTFSANMNYDAIKEIQVITGGMDAEYGRALGGAVNVVTKDGGNDFEATISSYFRNQHFRVYTPAPFDDPESDSDFFDGQLALNVGGPIVKDKVWFFVSAQGDLYRDSVKFDNEEVGRPEGDDPITPWEDEMSVVPARDWRSGYLFGKVTWQPNASHRVWAHAQTDPTKITNSEQDPYPALGRDHPVAGWLAGQRRAHLDAQRQRPAQDPGLLPDQPDHRVPGALGRLQELGRHRLHRRLRRGLVPRGPRRLRLRRLPLRLRQQAPAHERELGAQLLRQLPGRAPVQGRRPG